MNLSLARVLGADLPLSRIPTADRYILDLDTKLAVQMAIATGRPLLIVGEAGCGKTQLALALACEWEVPLHRQVVSAATKAEDLLYHFDAVARLADAQVYSVLPNACEGSEMGPLNPAHYLRPGILWWGWNWTTASDAVSDERFRAGRAIPDKPSDWIASQGSVVLIDEIDKASIEVPEGLLDVLDTGGFDVPWTGQRVSMPASQVTKPLVIITSNGARELPPPFLRRCIVLAMTLPKEGLNAWLMQRARAHFSPGECSYAVVQAAASILVHERTQARQHGRYVPGVSEFLDLLRAFVELAGDDQMKTPEAFLQQLAPFVTEHKGHRVDE